MAVVVEAAEETEAEMEVESAAVKAVVSSP